MEIGQEIEQTFARMDFITAFAKTIAMDRRALESSTHRPDLTADQIKVASPLIMYGTMDSAPYPWGQSLNKAKVHDPYLNGDMICVDIVHENGPQDSIWIPLSVFTAIFEEMKTWPDNAEMRLENNVAYGRAVNTDALKNWIARDINRLEAFYLAAVAAVTEAA